MSKKKDTEIEIVETDFGATLKVGTKTVAEITEEEAGSFSVAVNAKNIATVNSFDAALEEAIKAYNLSV
ncbi:DUF2969 family protein [Lactococcus termiticola]|uniref:DUF2969 domain-containing protein n=1 Tax=Lactococcus termiticola TaxID=2169526 RepID=A0A2R5HKU3_9LACT|nr:DUF2969 family protein [Lactococcus termiticola]GBG97271.1 hypothetical protein NtB2_01410 [Lactococcus termiticola]